MTQTVPILLLTRPAPASRQFADDLGAAMLARLRVVISPLMGIVAGSGALETGDARGLIFTSANGVSAVAARIAGRDLPCYCVGAATAEAARAAGWKAEALGANADDLVATMVKDPVRGPLLHLRGTHARGDIAARLGQAGCEIRETVVYDQRLQPLGAEALEALNGTDPVMAPLFSPRTARHFAKVSKGCAPIYPLALSEAVAEPLQNRGFGAIRVAASPDSAAMRAEIEFLLNALCRVEGGSAAQ